MISIEVQAKRTGENPENVQLSSITSSFIGAMAGATSGFLTTPFDVIKTKQMTF
jgi:hypothetical protein